MSLPPASPASIVPIAAVQMISGPDVAANLHEAERLIAAAATQGARLVALPEYFPLIGASDADRLAACEADEGHQPRAPIQSFLSQTARRHGIWLVGGSIPLAAHDPSKLRNACLVYDPDGQQRARYDKMHLFGFQRGNEQYDERQHIEAGGQIVRLEVDGLGALRRIGLAICYDLRFPELFRALGEVDLLVIPAAFTETTGQAHWTLLLRARAVENQCYVLAAAQGGLHPNGRQTHGNSMLIDPWGDIVARLDKGSGIALGNFDAQRLAEVRASLPALRHRIL